jgi:limonene-1,2-epoxide hydrolase
MGAKQEAVVREFTDLWRVGELPDIDAIVGMFSEDAVWQPWVPGGSVFRGRDAIRAEIEHQVTIATYFQCNLLDIASNDRTVYAERLDQFTVDSKRLSLALASIYEIDDRGYIVAWREYFDTADVARQMGVSPHDLAGPSS